MHGVHVKFEVVPSRSHRNDVTSFQVENPAYVRGTLAAPLRDLNHGYHSAVYPHKNPSSGMVVGLQVNIVSPLDRHSQFSIMVLHTTCKMAERGTDRPVFDH